ncbi:uncharacterized protein LOC113859150 [Abrus precatorius]|uniref:Uncharacterized protein LOC113859150 n=1 Tax=Abrus precatorius TaxID=3816 RepID=A0A8B8KV49_ABRPR|nr:uncharacterized protein LOC113859150 [Abrus precatorius]
MDLFDPNRFSNRKSTPSGRFLRVPSQAPPLLQNPNDELHEDDVVFFADNYNAEPNHQNTSTSSPSTPNHHHSFGILAALPENETSPNRRNVSPLFHKASGSSSRLIPSIPRPPALSSSVRFHQSAPLNVPILSEAMTNARRKRRELDADDGGGGGEEEEEEEEMVPPHEITARNSAQSQMLACSVLEGVGRTLKGRDLRQVRNAVWRQTENMK